MSQTPTFSEVLRAALDARLMDVHVSMPARVESYNASRLSVEVQPMIERAYIDESGDRQTKAFPVVPDVPVKFPGSGDYRITFPITKGDIVLLVISESSLDKWLDTERVVDPLDDRRHQMIDAVALPGLHSFKAPSAASEDALVVEGDEIRLGSADATDPVALKSDLDALKTFLGKHFDTGAGHTHASVGAPPTIGTGTGTGFSIPTLPGATKVNGE